MPAWRAFGIPDWRAIRITSVPGSCFDGSGGIVSFELKGGVAEAERFMRRTTVPINAPSLGGVETLVTRPATTSHSGISADQRRQLGISDHLIRLSVGIEATEEIIEDFDHALGE